MNVSAQRVVSSAGFRRLRTLFLLCTGWGVLIAIPAGLVYVAPLELAEHSFQDAVVRQGKKNTTPDGLVFLALDEASLDLSQLDPEEIEASPTLQMMSEQFPWSRAVYAAIIEKVLGAGAKAIALDIHFPMEGAGDSVLKEVIDQNRDKVVIGGLYEDTSTGETLATQYRPPTTSVLPPGAEEVGVVGFVNFWPESDRVVRAAHYRMTDDELLGRGFGGGEERSSLAVLALEKAGLPVGDVPRGALMRFCPPASFKTVPIWTMFVPDLWEANLKNGEVFRDKIVLLGPLASRFRDQFRTPVGTLPGPEIHLHSIAAAMNGAYYERSARPALMASCVAMGLLAFAVSALVRRPLVALGVLGLLLLGWLVAALLAYNLIDWLPGGFYPLLSLAFAGLTAFGYDFSLEKRERTRVRRSLERYVSRDVVHELLDTGGGVLAELGGSRKDVAVLFSDLRGFTKISEHADPAELVANLNEYLGAMVEIVFRHHGTLDKFIGDAVMAVWGTIGSAGRQEDAGRAVRTSLDMLAAVAKLRKAWLERGAPDLRLGIGLHFGPVIFGNIGSDLKMEPTVIGDTVNLASRLESLTKHYGLQLLLSETLVEAAGPIFPFRTIDTVRVVGRGTAVTIFTVPLDDEGLVVRPAWLDAHERGWAAYRDRRFAEAAELFAEGEGTDEIIDAMIVRCRGLAENPPGPEWEPVTVMGSK